ncbi:hypothetical protein [Tropicimonas sp. S265A]|uniref:hypothetical protein n=1 Tax=Tropicimonas sp. S265A TaxID=3415134 RepID=UPI003C7C3EF4
MPISRLRKVLATIGLSCVLAQPLAAEDKAFTLQVAPDLMESGLVNYIVPRFSMKTGIRVTVEPLDAAPGSAAQFGPDVGAPVIARAGTDYGIAVPENDAGAVRFEAWLRGEVGQRTMAAFAPETGASFEPVTDRPEPEPDLDMSVDVSRGIELSLAHCGRCHVIGPQNRMNGIDSTPSFGVLRTLSDWQRRFETFYLLNPHPAFTQITEVTEAFPLNRPSPIVPVEITLEDLDEILAFVARMEPAELGAPIRHQ